MRFAFGKNWQSYSQKALTPERIEHARQAFRDLLVGIDLQGRRFLDIGFGQGLSLLTAVEMGAEATGIDIDKDNLQSLRLTREAMGCSGMPEIQVQSILDDEFVQANRGRYDVVHSWGVLHHTGNMTQAIKNACELVAADGWFICAIYNRHWSSFFWKAVKWIYNKLPSPFQRLLVALLYPVIYLAKWLVTGQNPKKKKRGMDFFHDVVDWVGGYPYEYAGVEEILKLVGGLGFECVRCIPAQVPTGCNEFVFKRTGDRR